MPISINFPKFALWNAVEPHQGFPGMPKTLLVFSLHPHKTISKLKIYKHTVSPKALPRQLLKFPHRMDDPAEDSV
jgi:hypothetical protein